jgi:hypothetical protein
MDRRGGVGLGKAWHGEATMKSKAAQGRISKKIGILRDEGVKQDQAVATAINMEKKHRLTPGGGYRRVSKKK